MFRFLTIALLAGAAIPAVAVAQGGDRPRAERSGGWRGASDSGQRPAATPRFERQPRSFDRPRVNPEVRSQPDARPTDRGAWRANRDGGGQRGTWSGNRTGNGWRAPAPTAPVAAPQPQPQPAAQAPDRGPRRDWNGNNGQRNWDRNTSARRDWNRDAARRDWNRNNDRRDWNRNDGRRDWNDRRFDNNRSWNGNWFAGGWDRGWRNDRRYNWQGYRTSNRHAYRWPQYYAPRGWNYGYRRFDIGATLFSGLFAQSYWIGNPFDYRLPPVNWPLQWVRYYDDALLVDTTTGEVIDAIPGIFW